MLFGGCRGGKKISYRARCKVFPPGSGAHAPNEYMVIQPKEGLPIADLAEIERGYIDTLFALAGV